MKDSEMWKEEGRPQRTLVPKKGYDGTFSRFYFCLTYLRLEAKENSNSRWEGSWGWVNKVKGIKRYKFPVTNQISHRM